MTSISVVTAVYNRRGTVAQALDSVLSQTHSNIETVVIDGASTDGTKEILDAYRSRIGVFVSEPDTGIYDALNKGIGLATSDVVGFLHADDLFAHDNVLANVAHAFDSNPSVQAVYGDLVYVTHEDPCRVVRYWRAGDFNPAALRRGWMPPHPTFYVRRSAYSLLGLFDTSYRIAADYELMLRFLTSGQMQVAYIPEVLVRMRTGGASNASLRAIIKKSQEDFRAIRANRVGNVGTLLLKNIGKLSQFWMR